MTSLLFMANLQRCQPHRGRGMIFFSGLRTTGAPRDPGDVRRSARAARRDRARQPGRVAAVDLHQRAAADARALSPGLTSSGLSWAADPPQAEVMTRRTRSRRLRGTEIASQTPERPGVRARKRHAAVHTVSSERYARYGIDASAPTARTYEESEAPPQPTPDRSLSRRSRSWPGCSQRSPHPSQPQRRGPGSSERLTSAWCREPAPPYRSAACIPALQ